MRAEVGSGRSLFTPASTAGRCSSVSVTGLRLRTSGGEVVQAVTARSTPDVTTLATAPKRSSSRARPGRHAGDAGRYYTGSLGAVIGGWASVAVVIASGEQARAGGRG